MTARALSRYERALEGLIAWRKQALQSEMMRQIVPIPRETLSAWLAESMDQSRDFYTLVASRVLGVDYFEVMPVERHAAKEALFIFMYSPCKHDLFRLMQVETGDEIVLTVVKKREGSGGFHVELGEIIKGSGDKT